jgi:hypothetical protein
MDPAGPKYQNWTRHIERFLGVLSPDMRYWSAFVSRPDSAPWINFREYALEVQSLWAGKRVAVLCERKGSMMLAVRPAAKRALHVQCPREQAYDGIGLLELRILDYVPEVAILSCGPTATCLANRLTKHGIQAVDLGSAGGFLARLLR